MRLNFASNFLRKIINLLLHVILPLQIILHNLLVSVPQKWNFKQKKEPTEANNFEGNHC